MKYVICGALGVGLLGVVCDWRETMAVVIQNRPETPCTCQARDSISVVGSGLILSTMSIIGLFDLLH